MRDKPHKNNFLHKWRYYGFSKDAYTKGMDKAFPNNIENLRYLNFICFVLVSCYALFSAVVDKNAIKLAIHCIVVLVALALYIFTKLTYERKKVLSRRTVYFLIALYYANIMWFGIYIGVLVNRNTVASSFMGFMIVTFLLLTISPLFMLAASSCAFVFFIIATVLCKDSSLIVLDIGNVVAAYAMSLAANWAINKYRLQAVLSEMTLKEERNKWFGKSTIDPLSQLNNRRSFLQRFQRCLTSHRDTDKWLAVAVIDIDYFKEYNDYYGHLKGDELIHALGKVLNDLQASREVFAARTGGDEFMLLWLVHERSSVDAAEDVVSCLQEKVAALQIPHAKSKACDRLSLSIGVYVASLDSIDTTDLSAAMKTIYDCADHALYEAKRAGKNRVVIRHETVENAGGGTTHCTVCSDPKFQDSIATFNF